MLTDILVTITLKWHFDVVGKNATQYVLTPGQSDVKISLLSNFSLLKIRDGRKIRVSSPLALSVKRLTSHSPSFRLAFSRASIHFSLFLHSVSCGVASKE